jgi:DNA-binding transcriptional LysR family regulator
LRRRSRSCAGRSAPRLPPGRTQAVEALAEGRAELALGILWEAPDWISGERFYEEGFLVAGRADALPEAPRIGLDAYCAEDHVLVSPAGDLRGIVDQRLENLGRARRVVLGLPAFLPALAAVAASGGLVTLPARLARAFAPGFGLVTADPPLEIRGFPVSVFWHRRNDGDPRTIWLRDRIRACVGA